MKQRICDSDFLFWVSSDELSTDFAYLRRFLENKSTDYSKFMKLFLIPGKQYAEEKEIAQLKQKSTNPFAKAILASSIDSLCRLKNIPSDVKSQDFEDMFKTCFFLPEFISRSLFNLIAIKIYNKKTKTVKFKDIIKFMSDNFTKSTIDDLFFFTLSEDINAKTCKTQCLFKILYRYVSTDKKFASLDLESQGYRTKEQKINILSDFAIYICAKIETIFDSELHGKLERRYITLDLFLKALNNFALFDHFVVVLSKFKQLQSSTADFISFRELLEYDRQRVDQEILKKVLSILSNKSDNINFHTFVKFVTFLEDKASVGALNFWFKVCDMDEDGYISVGEMEYLYKKQVQKLKSIGIDTDPFEVVLPELMDAINVKGTQISRKDLRASGRWMNFFNILVDPKMYNDSTFKDPLFSFALNASAAQTSLWDEYVERGKYN